ncbi:MAG: hypothetical protein A3A30_01030 [Candidatus Terrybacteria bacterium RIFCSPLOWO2_01_FULL_48_14]|nr:MAG: hypothetical protein A3A30_01030 [Candidatus Terrybacteria bacterium RIFCSPLOWO2_01_FULL_48_14]
MILQKENHKKAPAIRINRTWRRSSIIGLRHAFGMFFIAAGIALFGFWAIQPGSFLAASLTSSLPSSIPAQPDVPVPEIAATLNANNQDAPRLVIEKIGVNMPIVEGKDESALLKGAWRSPWSSTPDQGGNTVLFGHRWYHKPPHPETFYALDKIAVGDTFNISWKGAIYHYQVIETKVVSPKEISVLKPTDDSVVTLITCTPLYSTKQRLIVRAKLL